jgi:hypothetical protein
LKLAGALLTKLIFSEFSTFLMMKKLFEYDAPAA